MNLNRIFFALIFITTLLLMPKLSLAETVSYQYDSFGQLNNAQYGAGLHLVYVYDAIGNRESFTLTAPTGLAGDINGDSAVDLTDVIFGLKISSGENVVIPINKSSEVNNDNKIGMEEVIYIMQKMAE